MQSEADRKGEGEAYILLKDVEGLVFEIISGADALARGLRKWMKANRYSDCISSVWSGSRNALVSKGLHDVFSTLDLD